MASDIILKTNDLEIKANNIRLISASNKDMGSINTSSGNIVLGGNGKDGDILLRDGKGDMRIHISSGIDSKIDTKTRFYVETKDAKMFLGGDNTDGVIRLLDKKGKEGIQINAGTGDILLSTIGSLVQKIEQLEKRLRKLETT